MATRYPIGGYLRQMGTLLGISPERVLRRAGLSATLSDETDVSVTPDKFFAIWDAVCAEADKPGFEMELAMAYAHGPFVPPIFAFSCADTLALGLERLSDFKPLIGPFTMDVSRPEGHLQLNMQPSEPDISMPPSMGLFELLYVTECARTFTGKMITPIKTSLPGPLVLDQASLDYLSVQPKTSDRLSLTFSAEHADLPLITRSTSLWETLEPGFQEQLEARVGKATLSSRIKRTLTETLPGGSTTVNDMARRLNISKRSLQRRLNEEGTSYQELLNETRLEMSERFLKTREMTVPEISFLLGFRDTSSFFRAFHEWTGMTPGDYRSGNMSDPDTQLH